MSTAWQDVTQKILDALDIAAEYKALGLDIVGSQANHSGWLSCRAYGREDHNPSAGINVGHEHPLRGRYKEFTGDGESCSLFDFAVRAGKFTTWEDARKDYAHRMGIPLPRTKHPSAPEDSLEFCDYNEALIENWCYHHKIGVAPGAVRVSGAKLARWPSNGEFMVIALPIIGPLGTAAAPTGWVIWNLTGKPLLLYQGENHPRKPCKVLSTGGSVSGLLNVYGINRMPTAAYTWVLEGPSDMLAHQSSIPREEIERHAVVANSGGTLELVKPEFLPQFSGHTVYVLHDPDKDGYAGGCRWASSIATVGRDARHLVLPVRRAKNHGIDIRDLLSGTRRICKKCGGSGSADEIFPTDEQYQEIDWAPGDCPNCGGLGHLPSGAGKPMLPIWTFADTMALALRSEPIVSAAATIDGTHGDDGEDPATLMERIVCKELGLVVDGEVGKEVKVWSIAHRKFGMIDTSRMTYEDILKLAGPIAKRKIHLGRDEIPGMYKVGQLRGAIAILGGYRNAEQGDRGIGCWAGRTDDDKAVRSIVMVNKGEAGVYHADTKEFSRHETPFVEGLVLDLSAEKPWYSFEAVSRMLKDAQDPMWRTNVINRLMAVGESWFWTQGQGNIPAIYAGLVLATWVQTCWEWRPLVSLTGPSDCGKSTLFDATSRLFGGLCMLSSKSSEAGLRQYVKQSARIILCDEFESDDNRNKVLELFRTSSRGSIRLQGTQNQKGTHYGMRHIPWVAAIELGMDREPDRNRFVPLELERPPKKDRGKLRLPSPAELEDLGQRSLAVAIVSLAYAKCYAEYLRGMTVPGVHGRIIESFAVPIGMLAAACGADRAKAEQMLTNALLGFELGGNGVFDESKLIHTILSSFVDLGHGDRASVSQLLAEPDSFGVGAGQALERHGLGLTRHHGQDCVFVAADAAKRFLLRGTVWEHQDIAQILRRLPGAERLQVRIAGRRPWGIAIPRGAMDMDGKNGQQLQLPLSDPSGNGNGAHNSTTNDLFDGF